MTHPMAVAGGEFIIESNFSRLSFVQRENKKKKERKKKVVSPLFSLCTSDTVVCLPPSLPPSPQYTPLDTFIRCGNMTGAEKREKQSIRDEQSNKLLRRTLSPLSSYRSPLLSPFSKEKTLPGAETIQKSFFYKPNWHQLSSTISLDIKSTVKERTRWIGDEE